MDPQREIQVWSAVWLGAALWLVLRHWKGNRGVGLLFTYLVSFGLIHFIAPVMNLLPWFQAADLSIIASGLKQSAYAMVAFAVGVEVVFAWGGHRPPAKTGPGAGVMDGRMVTLYLLTGVFMYMVVFPVAGRFASVVALASAGAALLLAGMCLTVWNAWRQGKRVPVWFWLLASTSLPLATVVIQGFLGYGFAAMLTVFTFVASFYRPRWKVAVVAMGLAYLGMSVYVTYMRDRGDIRNVVWGGGTLSERSERIYETFSTIEFFDPYDRQHLLRVDQRLNQDFLVGAAVAFLDASPTSFARGSTLSDAMLGFIPRAVWPDKPVVAGSGDLVSEFTGIRFAEGTSVGIGQVMEAYVNFGTPGVIIIFIVLGGLVARADRSAREALERGDIHGFTLWFLPGLSLLQVGGSFVEVTSSAAAAVVVALLVERGAPLILGSTRPPIWTVPVQRDVPQVGGR